MKNKTNNSHTHAIQNMIQKTYLRQEWSNNKAYIVINLWIIINLWILLINLWTLDINLWVLVINIWIVVSNLWI